jgi:type IV pilus assembly protein PilW
MIKNKQQAGVTLIELMIGLALGLFIVGGVLSVYLAVTQSSRELLDQSRLNQEMSAIMNIMTGDIRRAGYWSDAGGNQPETNPFSVFNTTVDDNSTALEVRDASGNVFISATASGNCIIYAYDAAQDNSVEATDRLGFRWGGNASDPIMMRTSATTGDSCDEGDGSWEAITDTSSIAVTALTFDLSESQCINASEPDDVDSDSNGTIDDDGEINCYVVVPVVGDGHITTEIRDVQITLTAQLVSDSLVSASMTQTVRVRNDLVRQR